MKMWNIKRTLSVQVGVQVGVVYCVETLLTDRKLNCTLMNRNDSTKDRHINYSAPKSSRQFH